MVKYMVVIHSDEGEVKCLAGPFNTPVQGEEWINEDKLESWGLWGEVLPVTPLKKVERDLDFDGLQDYPAD